MRSFIHSLLIGLALSGCTPVAPPPAVKMATPDRAVDELLVLMRQRLDVMHDVARFKWAKKSAINDPAREKALLDDVAERGRQLGLDPADTRAFFTAQIEAAKLVQRADFRRWEADQSALSGAAPDLAGVLRPRINALNRDLLVALAKVRRSTRPDAAGIRSRADQLLASDEIDAEVRETAVRPLIPSGK